MPVKPWPAIIGSLAGGLIFLLEAYSPSIETLARVASLIVAIGALLLYARPSDHVLWGSLVMIMALTSFFGPGAFWIILILPMVGGIAGLLWKPSQVS